MKKWLIGSIIGAILVFAWQGLSWTMLGIHNDAAKYHPAQDSIINYLSSTITEEGSYMIPGAKPGSTKKDHEDLMKQMEGKPWAFIIYHKSFSADMTMVMIRGFLVDIFLVISLIYILTRGSTPIPRRVFSGSVALGLFLFLWGPYTGHIWFNLPWGMIKGDLIDAIVAWSLCGIWLGWWLNRNVKVNKP
jgi:hypothetical protein